MRSAKPLQSPHIASQRAPGESESRIQKRQVADAMVEFHSLGDFQRVGILSVAEIGDFVDQTDRRGQEQLQACLAISAERRPICSMGRRSGK